MKKTTIAIISALTFAVGAGSSATAGTICAGCESIDGQAGTFIGSYQASFFDNGSFNHTNIQSDVGASTAFNDFFVFDLSEATKGSVSADFTSLSAISNFVGALWTDGGSSCSAGTPAGCSAIVPGSELYRVSAVGNRFEIQFNMLAAGRYIIQITGVTQASGPSNYSGQLSFEPVATVPLPAAFPLMIAGIAGLAGMASRRRRA
jgi:hypothetical protein